MAVGPPAGFTVWAPLGHRPSASVAVATTAPLASERRSTRRTPVGSRFGSDHAERTTDAIHVVGVEGAVESSRRSCWSVRLSTNDRRSPPSSTRRVVVGEDEVLRPGEGRAAQSGPGAVGGPWAQFDDPHRVAGGDPGRDRGSERRHRSRPILMKTNLPGMNRALPVGSVMNHPSYVPVASVVNVP